MSYPLLRGLRDEKVWPNKRVKLTVVLGGKCRGSVEELKR